MIQKYALICLAFFAFVLNGFGQIVAWDFTGEANVATSTAEIFNTNLDSSPNLTRGAGALPSAGANSFRTTGFQNNGISTANTDYFQFTLSADVGYLLSLSTIDARLTGTGTFTATPGVSSQFAYSLDGINFTLIGTAQATTTTPADLTQINLLGIAALQNIPETTTVTFRYYASGQTTTGGWGFFSNAAGVYGLAIGGALTPVVAGCNITSAGLTALSCDDNGTDTDPLNDFLTFDLDPTGSDLGATYSVSVSGGSITPTTGTYGANTTFTLQDGSAGAGDVTVTITDNADATCTLDVVITDPGSCSTGGVSVCLTEDFESNGTNPPTDWIMNSIPYGGQNCEGSRGMIFNGNGDSAITPVVNNPQTLTFQKRRSGDATAWSMNVQISTNAAYTTWATVTTITTISTTCATETVDLTAYPGDRKIRFIDTRASGANERTIDNVEVICGPNVPQPELQLVDANGVDQNCGYTINFGSQALTTDNDIIFDIENIGLLDLDISTLTLSGANEGDYTIVSPVGAFTVAPAGSQELVVRFTPTANGTRTATITINNNDANEGTCTVELTGVGFTPAPEINVEGNVGAFPDIIGDGLNNPSGTNNTLYAAQFIGSSQTKSFWVNNEGTSNLTITNISLGGDNPGDFTIDVLPNFTITPGSIRNELLEITFSPLAAGERNATVTIVNNDADEANFVFNIRGTGNCVSNATSITPTLGPEGTVVTVTGTDFGGTTTATVSGIAATVTVLSATQIEVTIPAGVTSGNIVVLNNLGCASTNGFTVIDNAIASCEGSGVAPSDLFISEVTDATTGGVSYIELYNGTGNPVNLGDYGLAVHGNGASTPSYTLNLNSVVLNNNDVYVVAIGIVGSQNSTNSCSITGGNGQLADQTSILAGINKKDNEHDMIRLVRAGGSVIVDAFGVYESLTWMDATIITGDRGFNFRRLNSASPLPNPVFNLADWNVIDWVGTGQTSCGTNDYSDIGIFDFSVGTPPNVSTLLAPTSDCDLSATLTVTGTEGFADGNPLAYQWYYSAPGQLGWTEVPNNAIYSGATTDTLEILNTLTLDGYQYYCQVREDDATCYTASNAVKVSLAVKTWNGPANGEWYEATNWIPAGVPLATDNVVIPSGSPVLTGGGIPIPPTRAFAKSLLVQTGATLLVPSGQNLIVEQCILNNGTITLENTANLVQTHTGTDLNSGSGDFSMQRIVTSVQNFNYIYWSSPIAGVDVATLPGSGTHRYYWDPTATNANLTQGDWISASGEMEKGKGYIIRYSAGTVTSTFAGSGIGQATPHNGDFTVTIEKGTLPGIDDNWNLIGNPYPSAISADTFIVTNSDEIGTEDTNPAILGTLYLWQHQGTPNTATDPFYEDFQINYNGDNYVAYNVTGVNPPTSQNGFDGYIASGQAFFVLMDETYFDNTATVTFDNSVRYDNVDPAYENTQFLRQAAGTENGIERHRIWIDLIAPNNTSVSTLVGYITGATNYKDRLFDGYETNATGLGFYSMVGYERMGIQGRALPFDENDTVPLGANLLQTGTYTIAINQVDGLFEAGQHIFLEDTYTNTIHNLRATPYTFYSVGGMFNDRFILRYTSETLSIPDTNMDTGLTIVELSNGNVKFTVGHNLTIQSVEIYDMLGRQLYNLPGTHAIEVYDLANLSQAAYIAKVTLSNGQTVTKRAVKRQ